MSNGPSNSAIITDFPTGLITIAFTDLEGSAELWERHAAAFQPVLNEHNRLIRAAAARWGGVEVKTIGDSFLLVFKAPRNALQWAVAVQRAFAQQTWPLEIGELRVRIGMHAGEPYLGQHPSGAYDYFGPAVNRASRIEAAAHGGQILISQTTRDLTQAQSTPAELSPAETQEPITLRDLGTHRLKGIGTEHLWQVVHPDLPADFPPPRTLPITQVHLPDFLTPFRGRENDVPEIKELLLDDATRLLTLLGPGGVGKTRLAVRVAEEAASAFSDGVWFVEFETATNEQDFFTRLIHHLNLELSPGKSEEQSVLDYVRDKRLLLVLDNVEQIPEAAVAVDKLVRNAPRSKYLVSSRERFQMSGARAYEVHPLAVPSLHASAGMLLDCESVQFFVERAREHQRTFEVSDANAPDIARLCRQLEGVPLALELAAAWTPDLTPREIFDEMREQLDVLSVEHLNIPERQRAIRSSIDWSYTRLPEEEQRVLALLTVFAGGFTRESVSAVCQLSKPNTIALLRKLHGKSLLTHTESGDRIRYGMLNTIQLYMREQLQQHADEPAIGERHAAYFLTFAREHTTKLRTKGEIAALAELEADLDNVRTALNWYQQRNRFSQVMELALALSRFLQRRGFFKEALLRIEAGLDAMRALPEEERLAVPCKRLHAELCRERASLHLDYFEWAQGRDRASEALELFQEIADHPGQADAHNLIALSYMHEGDYVAARADFAKALAQLEHLEAAAGPTEVGKAVVLHNLGLIENETGHPEAATEYFTQALDLRRTRGDQRGIAETSNNLGVIAFQQGRWDEAWQYYLESLQGERQLRSLLGTGRALYNLEK